MDVIEELKKKLHCQKCEKYYDNSDNACKYQKCGHHTCGFCFVSKSNRTYECPFCSCSSTISWFPNITDIHDVLQKYTSQNDNHYKCGECEKSDSEQDMQLCETCHGLKFENYEDVKKNVLSSTCAIKKHIRKGHETVDFYPYLSAYNFSSQLPKIESKSEDYKSAQDLLKNTFSVFSSLSSNVSENYSMLTDMARRSKNSKQQVEFFEKMEKFIDKSKSIHSEADSDMKNHTTKLKETLAEIKKWYDSNMGNCVDESEIIKLKNSEDVEKNDMDLDEWLLNNV